MPEFLAERYQSGLGLEDLKSEALRLTRAVAAMHQDGATIEFLGMTFLPGDEGVFAHFISASEDLVARAHELATLRFDRIVPVQPVELDRRVPAHRMTDREGS